MKNLLSLFYILFSSVTFAQNAGNYNYNNLQVDEIDLNTVFLNDSTARLNAKVLINVKPAEQVAIFSITQNGENLEQCQSFMNQRLNGFLSELKKSNIKDQDIYIDIISQVPTYEYDIDKKIFSKTANEVPTGFELKKNVHIYLSNDNSLLEKIMTIAAQYEIYDYVKSDYYISTAQRVMLQDSLENVAINLIKKKQKKVKLLDFDLETNLAYKTFSESFDMIKPNNRYDSYLVYNVEKTKTYKKTHRAEKTTTIYYSNIDYDLYDLVINPIILAPSIQIAYELEVRYVFRQK